MKRVAVVGSGGAGKSRLARRLGEITGIDVVHLDRHYWNPGWVQTPAEEWEAFQRELVRRDRWIVDGNYGRTVDIRLAVADTVVFCDVGVWTCLWGIVKRRFSSGRPDIAPGCPEQLNRAFVRWVWRFPKDSRPRLVDAITRHADHLDVVHLRSRRHVRRWLEDLARM